jgi:hypothetical protein
VSWSALGLYVHAVPSSLYVCQQRLDTAIGPARCRFLEVPGEQRSRVIVTLGPRPGTAEGGSWVGKARRSAPTREGGEKPKATQAARRTSPEEGGALIGTGA